MSDQHRYLIQRFFDNERRYNSTTVGGMTLAITATINGGGTSATLTGSWQYPTGTQIVTFTNSAGTTATTTALLASGATSGTLTSNWTGPSGFQSITFGNANNDTRDVTMTNGSTSITWTVPLTGACTSTTITTKATSEYHPVLFTNGSTAISWSTPLYYGISSTTITTQGFQSYAIPANISKITDDTITIGQLRYTPAPVMTRDEWNRLNTLPYTSDIPNYFYIYNGNVEFFPIPSTTGNPIAFYYKARVPDFASAFIFSDTSGTAFSAGSTSYDYQNGSLTGLTLGSTSITGSATSWNTTGKYPLNTDVSFFNLYLQIAAPSGEGIWYPISKFTSDTALTLATPLQNVPSTTTAAHGYSIAQLPLLNEDFADMIVYGALMTYFSAIVPDQGRFQQYKALYDIRMQMLKEYAGSKQINVDLGATPNYSNPNLYLFSNS